MRADQSICQLSQGFHTTWRAFGTVRHFGPNLMRSMPHATQRLK
jgi:hypothetical protein